MVTRYLTRSTRYLTGFALAFAVTFALFYLMQALIETDENPLSDPVDGDIVQIVPVIEEKPVEPGGKEPERPDAPEDPPPVIDDPEFTSEFPGEGGGYRFEPPESTGEGDPGDPATSGELLPIVKVQPVYPRRAQARGIEGYVVVEFTVTASGSVRDPRVVEAEPRGIFDRAAKEAARKFRYKPRRVNGEPTAVTGVRNVIRFELDGG